MRESWILVAKTRGTLSSLSTGSLAITTRPSLAATKQPAASHGFKPSLTDSRRRESTGRRRTTQARNGLAKTATSRDGSRRPGWHWITAAMPRPSRWASKFSRFAPTTSMHWPPRLLPSSEAASTTQALASYRRLCRHAAREQDLVAVGAQYPASQRRGAGDGEVPESAAVPRTEAEPAARRSRRRSRGAATTDLVVEIRGRVSQGARAGAAPVPGRALDRRQLDRRCPHAAGRLALVAGWQVHAGDGRDAPFRGVWRGTCCDGAPPAPAG